MLLLAFYLNLQKYTHTYTNSYTPHLKDYHPKQVLTVLWILCLKAFGFPPGQSRYFNTSLTNGENKVET